MMMVWRNFHVRGIHFTLKIYGKTERRHAEKSIGISEENPGSNQETAIHKDKRRIQDSKGQIFI